MCTTNRKLLNNRIQLYYKFTNALQKFIQMKWKNLQPKMEPNMGHKILLRIHNILVNISYII